MTISHLIIAVLVGKYNGKWADHRGAGWASVAFVSLKIFVLSSICFPLKTTKRTFRC